MRLKTDSGQPMPISQAEIARRLPDSSDSIQQDSLVITPRPDFNDDDQGSASIDLRLGTWFLSLRPARIQCLQVDDPTQDEQIAKAHYVRFGDRFILHPRNFVLGITLEWLRLPPDLAGTVLGKSSWGRRGLVIATATAVQPGFTGCLTLELANVGEIPIELKPGILICQLSLETVLSSVESGPSSQFSTSRRPRLGSVKSDDTARALEDAGDA